MTVSGIASRNIRRTLQVRNPRWRPVTSPATGTDIEFVNGSTLLNCSTADSAFLTEMTVGTYIKNVDDTDGDSWMKIASITDDDNLVLAGNYLGATDTAAPADVLVKRASGRQLSPGDMGAYVNLGDLGYGSQYPLPPGGKQTMPVYPVNMFSLQTAVAGGTLEVAQDTDGWFAARQVASPYTLAGLVEFTDLPVATQTGNITFSYKAYVGTGYALVTIVAEWYLPGTGWAAATEVVGGEGLVDLSASLTGEAHTFVWNSAVGATGGTGAVRVQNVKFRIRVTKTDAVVLTGTRDETGTFTVDNS